MTLCAQEFIRRFLLHVLPKGFMKIRYFGFLSHKNKKQTIPLIRKLIDPNAKMPEKRNKTILELFFRKSQSLNDIFLLLLSYFAGNKFFPARNRPFANNTIPIDRKKTNQLVKAGSVHHFINHCRWLNICRALTY
jgi:hypothetical protein